MYDDIQAVRTISNVVILFINLICLISILSILIFPTLFYLICFIYVNSLFVFILNYSNQWFIDASFKSRNQIKKSFHTLH